MTIQKKDQKLISQNSIKLVTANREHLKFNNTIETFT